MRWVFEVASRRLASSTLHLILLVAQPVANVCHCTCSELTPRGPTSACRGVNYDWGPAVGPHIFYKELQAAAWGIMEMCHRYTGCTIVIATDNAAVFFLLRRGFSGAILAIPHMDMIKEHLLVTGNTILPLLIPGVQNVSDSPTRDMELCPDRLKATWAHMVAAASGGSRNVAGWSAKRPRDFAELL